MSQFTVTCPGGNSGLSLSDEMLIRQIAAGDRLALRALLARHQVKVYRFALRIVRDAALAEDVVSETFFVYYQEKSIRDIAELLAIPESTVKTRMFYARKRLAALAAAAGIARAAA
jgi:DNA-directed RNA polymerase specialized sigma24 family protein